MYCDSIVIPGELLRTRELLVDGAATAVNSTLTVNGSKVNFCERNDGPISSHGRKVRTYQDNY